MAPDGGLVLTWDRTMPLEVAYMNSVSLTVFIGNMWTGVEQTIYVWQGMAGRGRVTWSPLQWIDRSRRPVIG